MKRPVIAGFLAALMAIVISTVVSSAYPAPAAPPITNEVKDW